MPCNNPGCAKKYKFNHIAYYARKRYIDGVSTIALMCSAKSEDEKILIVLASLPDFDDEGIRGLKPYCSQECQCEMFNLRDRLREMINYELDKSAASIEGRQIALQRRNAFLVRDLIEIDPVGRAQELFRNSPGDVRLEAFDHSRFWIFVAHARDIERDAGNNRSP